MCAARAARPGQRQGGPHPVAVALLPALHQDGCAMQTPQGYLHPLEATVGRRLRAHGTSCRTPACAHRPSLGRRACWPPARPGTELAAAGAGAAADGSAGTPSCRPAFSVASAPTRIFCALSSLRAQAASAPGYRTRVSGPDLRRRGTPPCPGARAPARVPPPTCARCITLRPCSRPCALLKGSLRTGLVRRLSAGATDGVRA